MTRRSPPALLLLPLLACTDLAILPEGARLTCGDETQCPAGYSCRINIGRCVPEADLNKTPIDFAVEPALDRTRVSHEEGYSVATLTATLSERPLDAPTVTVSGHALACGTGQQLSCMIDARALDLEEGVHSISFEAFDRAGNELSAELGVEVDLSAPDLVAEPVVHIRSIAGDSAFTALGPPGVASVDLVVDELVGAAPTLQLDGDPPLAATLLGAPDLTTEIAFLFELALGAQAAGQEQGERALVVDLVDDVGNAAVVRTATTLLVDIDAPAPPAVESPNAVVFDRQPWGSEAAPVPSFRVIGAAGAAEPGARIQARSEAALGRLFLGDAAAGPTGAFDLTLFPTDVARVDLIAVDGAGNTSAPVLVRDVRWTASLGFKIAGSRAENPHALFDSRLFNAAALDPNLETEADEVTDFGDLAQPTELRAESVFRFSELAALEPTGAPAVTSAGVAYHARRGTVMVYGGAAGFLEPASEKLLELRGYRFVTVEAQGLVPAGTPQLLYDWAADRLIAAFWDETWVLEDERWRRIQDPPTNLTFGKKLAFDRARNRTIATDGSRTYVLVSDEWQELEVSHPPSMNRVLFALGYDATRGGVILHGGKAAQNGAANSGELYLLEDEGWVLVGDSHPRAGHVLLDDPLTGAVYSVGGSCEASDSGCQDAQDTGAVLRLDGTSFTQLTSFDTRDDLVGPCFALDPGRGELLYFGGGTADIGAPIDPVPFQALTDLEGGGTLSTRRGVGRPGPRHSATTFFDPVADELLLAFGAYQVDDIAEMLSDIAVFGPAGARTLPAPGGDPPQSFHPFFDGVAVRFARSSTELVRRDGDTWAVDSAPAGFPGAAAAFAFHPGLGVAVGFGADAASDVTVTFDSLGNLTLLDPATKPPARRDASMIYDEARDAVLLFGGRNGAGELLTDTWAFDGADWSLIDDEGPASASQLLYDGLRHRPLLHDFHRIYELSDVGWVERPYLFPDERTEIAFGFDGERLLAVGGFVDFNSSQDVFASDGEFEARPGLVLEIDLETRRALPQSTILAIEIRATAGGRGFAFADGSYVVEPQPGVALLGWGDLWTSLGEVAADVDDPADLNIDVSERILIDALTRDRLHLALVPSVGHGPGGPGVEMASIAAHRFEATIVYRE